MTGRARAMAFKDHFSGHASAYAAHRPSGYPAALLDFLAGVAPGRDLAWDCATGSGQAAVLLAERFARVIATDASAAQVAHAEPHARVEYRTSPAEASGLEAGSVDLVTVAQAYHWFDFDRFAEEVRRVVRPGGVVAVWCYNLLRTEPPIDRVIDVFAEETVGAFWPPERRWVSEEYRTIPFPFPEIEAPPFLFTAAWDLPRLLAYVGTWSAIVRCRAATGRDPIAEVLPELTAAWGDPNREREIRWPLYVRIGRVGRAG